METKLNVMILGSGGREHALAWKLSQSKFLGKLYVAPGNAGTSNVAENLNIDPEDFEIVAKTVLENKINMLVAGSEAPIVKGLKDFFKSKTELNHVALLMPSAASARLEGSKVFAKQFMYRSKIPTAAYSTFEKDQFDKACKFIDVHNIPIVLKVDGLAAGKGVLICNKKEEAKTELKKIFMEEKFGTAGNKVVIEEFLEGIELSVTILTDGKNYVILPNAKDYKRAGEGDTGLNTGGMGAVSPVPYTDEAYMKKVRERIIQPTLDGLNMADMEFTGFIFFGLMNVNGNPFLLEYNVRLGDPETEAVIPRIKTDLLPLFYDVANSKLKLKELDIDERFAATVMLVSGGYPEKYEKGKEIKAIDQVKDSLVFHSGTENMNGKVLTAGGRVIAITSLHKDMKQALEISYQNAEKIQFEGKFFRKDIGFDL